MSVIIRLQNLPWSANALDIRNYFRGLSIPEGGVHIVGGELGDAFIAFSTDEDARQAMMLDGGKIKEIQVKLLLSSRSEMHKVIEAARQTVPLLSLAPAPAPPIISSQVPIPPPQPTLPIITPFSAALGNSLSSFGIPGIGNPQEIPQPAVIEPPAPLISPSEMPLAIEEENDEKPERKRSRDRRRTRSRSRSRDRDRDRKDRKRDRRDRSRSRDRRRRDRSRSRDRRDRKRDRKERSRSRDRSPSRRSRDKRRSPTNSQEKEISNEGPQMQLPFTNSSSIPMPLQQMLTGNAIPNGPIGNESPVNRFNDPSIFEAMNKMQELVKKRNPNAFQGDQQNGNNKAGNSHRGSRGGGNFRRENRGSRFDDQQRGCCVAVRNAPNHTSYGDVRRFFPFMIDKHGIKMINDNLGRRTGNIFVRFCEPRSKQLALQRKNNELKGAQVLVEELDDDTYEAALDSFLPYREDNDETELVRHATTDEVPASVPAPPPPVPLVLPVSVPAYAVLKLTELPYYVKEHDIIKTFNEFSLLSITLSDCRLTRSKTAYVQFAKPDDARLAFERRERIAFGRRQPTIVAVSDEEFEQVKNMEKLRAEQAEALAAMNRSPSPVEPAAPRDPRQRRPPFDPVTSQNSMLQAPAPPTNFFVPQFNPNQQAPFPAPFQNPAGFPGPGGFPAGGPGPAPTQAPLDPRSNGWGGPRQPVAPGPFPDRTDPGIDDTPLDCVLMKGLPCDATDRTIVNFLQPTGAVPARIHLMLDTHGMPSGDCFCEFQTAAEARRAAAKHGTHLEGCRVTVDPVPRSVVEAALEGPKPPDKPDMDGHMPQFFKGRGPTSHTFRGRGGFERGGRGGFDGGRGGFEGGRGGFEGGLGGFEGGRGGFEGGRGGFEGGRAGFEGGRGGFEGGRGGFEGRGGFRGRGAPRGGFDRGRGAPRGLPTGVGRNTFDNGSRLDDQDPALDDFGAPGCVVSMENVPFRATIDEILQFFTEFELTQDDVIRRYNERGQPTGDARVAFRTPFDAQRAVKTRHMNTIHDRRITLTIL